MTTLQKFKESDELEGKVIDSFLPTLESLGGDLDDFYQDGYAAEPLGDALHESGCDWIAPFIEAGLYRQIFREIHNLYKKPGTYEFYIDLMKKIFGEETSFLFEPGYLSNFASLRITVFASEIELRYFYARVIEEGQFVLKVLDARDDKGFLLFNDIKNDQFETSVENMFRKFAPLGVRTTVVISRE